MSVSLIAAMDHNRVIGAGGAMPWHLPADLKWFKDKTKGRAVIMGRKTWESIGKALPDRTNIVVTRQQGYSALNCLVAPDMPKALRLAGTSRETMIIGGAGVYAACLPMAQKLYLTIVHGDFSGDTWFPEFSLNDWQIDAVHHRPADEKNESPTSYYTLVRRPFPITDHPSCDGIPHEMRGRGARAAKGAR